MARLVGLVLVLAGATVFADPAPAPTPTPPAPVSAPAKVEPVAKDAKQPLRLVRITPDGKAALILDKNRNRSVLVEVGDGLAGYIVETIEDDAVTLVHKNGTQLVLATAAPAPAAPSGKPETKAPQDPYAPPAAPADPYAPASAPADPYAPPAAPADPYAPPATGPVTSPTAIPTPVSAPAPRVVSAPSTPGAPPVVSAPSAPAPVATPSAPAPVVATPPAPRPVAAAPVIGADGKIELKKADLDAALRDFGALAGSIGATFTAAGLKVDSVAAGSLFARAGLQAGDVVVAVEGKPLRTLDDAADLYARATTLRAVSVQVVRGGKPVSFQIAIR